MRTRVAKSRRTKLIEYLCKIIHKERKKERKKFAPNFKNSLYYKISRQECRYYKRKIK